MEKKGSIRLNRGLQTYIDCSLCTLHSTTYVGAMGSTLQCSTRGTCTYWSVSSTLTILFIALVEMASNYEFDCWDQLSYTCRTHAASATMLLRDWRGATMWVCMCVCYYIHTTTTAQCKLQSAHSVYAPVLIWTRPPHCWMVLLTCFPPSCSACHAFTWHVVVWHCHDLVKSSIARPFSHDPKSQWELPFGKYDILSLL